MNAGVWSCVFSEDRAHRYILQRSPLGLGGEGTVAWCMLNPSTADERNDDPTIRRVLGFSEAWGYERAIIVNLFAFRATDPKVMRAAADPIGPNNDAWIMRAALEARETICAWGVHGAYLERDRHVLRMLRAGGARLRVPRVDAGEPPEAPALPALRDAPRRHDDGSGGGTMTRERWLFEPSIHPPDESTKEAARLAWGAAIGITQCHGGRVINRFFERCLAVAGRDAYPALLDHFEVWHRGNPQRPVMATGHVYGDPTMEECSVRRLVHAGYVVRIGTELESWYWPGRTRLIQVWAPIVTRSERLDA